MKNTETEAERGVSFGSKLNRTQNRKEKEKLWQVFKKLDASMIAKRVSVVLLIAAAGFIGAGKKNEAAGRYEVCLLSRSLCEPLFTQPESDTAAPRHITACGALPAAYIVQRKRKFDLITALC